MSRLKSFVDRGHEDALYLCGDAMVPQVGLLRCKTIPAVLQIRKKPKQSLRKDQGLKGSPGSMAEQGLKAGVGTSPPRPPGPLGSRTINRGARDGHPNPWVLSSSLSGLSEPRSRVPGLADQRPGPETLHSSPEASSQSPPPSCIIRGFPRPPVA